MIRFKYDNESMPRQGNKTNAQDKVDQMFTAIKAARTAQSNKN